LAKFGKFLGNFGLIVQEQTGRDLMFICARTCSYVSSLRDRFTGAWLNWYYRRATDVIDSSCYCCCNWLAVEVAGSWLDARLFHVIIDRCSVVDSCCRTFNPLIQCHRVNHISTTSLHSLSISEKCSCVCV